MTRCANPDCGKVLAPNKAPGRRRKWCSEACRKSQYAGVCAVCGGPTDGTASGTTRPVTCCADCAPGYNARWTRETIVETIKLWVERYGEPPSASEWRGAGGGAPADRRAWPKHDWAEVRRRRVETKGPTTCTVQRVFGSWTAAIQAAGFDTAVGVYRREWVYEPRR